MYFWTSRQLNISLIFLLKEWSVQIPDILQIRKNKNSVIHSCSSNTIKSLGKISLSNEEVIGGLMLGSAGMPHFCALQWEF